MKKIHQSNKEGVAFSVTYYKFLETAQKIESSLKVVLKPLDLTHPQLNVLYLLAKVYPGTLNTNDISEKIIVNKPDVTRLVDRLVSKDYVSRGICMENRRKVDISITEKGLQVFEKAHLKAKEAVGNFFQDFLNEKESRKLYKLLNKINVE